MVPKESILVFACMIAGLSDPWLLPWLPNNRQDSLTGLSFISLSMLMFPARGMLKSLWCFAHRSFLNARGADGNRRG